MFNRFTLARILIFVAVLLLGVMFTGQIHAQTATPTPVSTPAGDVAEVPVDQLVKLLELLLANGGTNALSSAPTWVLVGVLVGLVGGYVLTRLTPTKTDDAIYDRVFGPLVSLLTGLIGALSSSVIPKTLAPPVGETITTKTETTSETEVTASAAAIPPTAPASSAEDLTIGGARPEGWETWKSRG